MEPKLVFSNPLVLPVLTSFFFLVLCSPDGLSFNFYAISCPGAEFIVRNTVISASESDPTIPGKLLRLLFHDCMVEGCDGSVLLQGNETERSDPANASLGGFAVLELAKRMLEIFCPGTVSCADVVALAARDAVEFAGGPRIQIPTGRRDGRVSLASNVRPNTIDTGFTLDEMNQIFSSKGLSIQDLVVLSGAHTIGLAHCSAFSDRFQQDSKGRLMVRDTSLDNIYAAELAKQCPVDASASTTVNNDPETSALFDNQYYQNLLAHKGLFQTDSVLLSNDKTMEKVTEFAGSQESFFQNWGVSFIKLSNTGVKTGNEGEIRTSCTVVNG